MSHTAKYQWGRFAALFDAKLGTMVYEFQSTNREKFSWALWRCRLKNMDETLVWAVRQGGQEPS